MSTKNEQLTRLLEALVRKELKAILPTLLPKLIKEAMTGMIMESNMTVADEDMDFSGNSQKRRNLVESSGYEEYPTMRANPQQVVGHAYRQAAPASVPGNINLPTALIGESGNPIPINPNAVPDFLIKALNKNYSEDLKNVSQLNGW